MNLTRERVRQLEARGLAKLRALKEGRTLNEDSIDEPLVSREIIANHIKEDWNFRKETAND